MTPDPSPNRSPDPGVDAEPHAFSLSDKAARVSFDRSGDDLAAVLSAVDHLLGDHDCDLVGYEEVVGARDRLRALPHPEPSLDAVATAMIHIRGAHNPTAAELDGDQEVLPCAWCRLAGEQAVEALYGPDVRVALTSDTSETAPG